MVPESVLEPISRYYYDLKNTPRVTTSADDQYLQLGASCNRTTTSSQLRFVLILAAETLVFIFK